MNWDRSGIVSQFKDDAIFNTVWTITRTSVEYKRIEPIWWLIAVSIKRVVMTFLSSHINVLEFNITSFNSENHKRIIITFRRSHACMSYILRSNL